MFCFSVLAFRGEGGNPRRILEPTGLENFSPMRFRNFRACPLILRSLTWRLIKPDKSAFTSEILLPLIKATKRFGENNVSPIRNPSDTLPAFTSAKIYLKFNTRAAKFLIIHYTGNRLLFHQLACLSTFSSPPVWETMPHAVRDIYPSRVASHVEIRRLNRAFHRRRLMCHRDRSAPHLPFQLQITRRWFQSAIFSRRLTALA